MSVTVTPATPAGTHRKLVSVTWPLLLIMSLMLLLSLASISILSALRAYVNGEGAWSKAEHEAIAELRRYSVSGREEDYRHFQEELTVPLGDHVARLQMQSGSPDPQATRRGFLAGRNDPGDIPGMVRLFRLFRRSSLLAKPVEIWTEGDRLIARLEQVGEELHEQIRSGRPKPRVARLMAEAERIHLRLAPLEDGFSAALGVASRQVANLLFLFLSFCSAVLVAVGNAISRRSLRQERLLAARLEYQATHDSLTGLTNRDHFELQLARAIEDQHRSATPCALLYLDLDQFKVINDTCGHAAGDELIRQIAWLIREELGSEDVLARLGGDEFGALLPNRPEASAHLLAEKIRRQIADLRFNWQGRVFVVTASIGVLALSKALPTVGATLSAVDQACYLAKDSGRNRIQFYRPDDTQVQTRHGEMRWVERIGSALDGGNFVLLAQEIRPVAARLPAAGDSRGPRLELLLRMVAPDGQLIAPMAFIPAAERFGLMPRIDRWVIAQACRELAVLRASRNVVPTCMINLSGASVSDVSLADYIGACLNDNGLPGRHVGFELTETAAIGNLSSAAQLMARLRSLGCPIALDDFGSGMSSFSYLKALPVDFLKIDGAFVRDISTDPIDFAVVEAIQRVGHVMGIHTVAECVEDQAALNALALIGVDYAQGYYVRRPVPLAEIDVADPAAWCQANEPVAPARVPSVQHG